METIKFTVAYYHGIGVERPLVILLDRVKGSFKRQYNTIEELKSDIGEDAKIYFIADKDNYKIYGNLYQNPIGILNQRDNFNFDVLSELTK